MSRYLLIVCLTSALNVQLAMANTTIPSQENVCTGLPTSLFESKFPAETRRLTLSGDMLETFVDLWKAGSRPSLPKRPERIAIYTLPGFPVIIAYQDRHCLIAYLAIDSKVLWRWLRIRLGWNA